VITIDIETIIDEYGTYIYNYALKLTCHPDKAQDIAQETFISAWKNIDCLKNDKAIKKWLRTICLNQFLMNYRKNDNKKLDYVEDVASLEADAALLTSDIPSPEEEVIVEEEIRELQNGCFYAMIRKLSLNQRIAFSLVDMFGLTIKEVAEILEISESAAKGVLYRARMNIDSFFFGHCDILDMKNPCRCKAWIEFSKTRESNQKNMKKLVDHLDYREKNYKFDESVRKKIFYLYQHMEEKKPSEEWYKNVIFSMKRIN